MWRVAALGLLFCACNRPYPATEMVALTPAPQRAGCAADADCAGAQLCVERACWDVSSVSACATQPIHFATDSDAIDARNRGELDQAAACLRSQKDVNVIVAGNADERGTSQHNEDLGQRRADAVAAYLQSLGVPQDRVATISHGAGSPICAEHDADCWRRNRRVDVAASRPIEDKTVKNKNTSDDDTAKGRRIDSTGNGTDNGSPLGK